MTLGTGAAGSPPVRGGRASLAPILVVACVDAFAYATVVPLIPFALRGQRAPYVAVGAVFAAFSLCQLITAPVLGRLSDRVGRRPVLALSLAGSAAGFALLAASSAFPIVLLSRIVDGCSAGNVAMCYAAALDSEREDERRRGIAALGATSGAGIVAGLGLGALLAGVGFRAVALAATLLSLLSLLLVLLGVQETQRRAAPSIEIAAALRLPGFRRGAVFVSLCAALQAAFLLALPAYSARTLGLHAQAAVALIAALVVVAGMFQFLALPRLMDRLGIWTTARALLAAALCAAVFIAVTSGGAAAVTLSAALLTTAAVALAPIGALRLAEGRPGAPVGLTMGINTAAATAGQVVGPVVGYAAFAAGGPRALGLACAALALCAAGTLGIRAGAEASRHADGAPPG